MSDEKPKVILAKQSYSEFAMSGLEEKLELMGIVSAESNGSINSLNKKLEEKAEELGATYVFGIQYLVLPNDNRFIIALGEAYRPAKKAPYR